MTDAPQAPVAPALPPENVQRGTVSALAIIPAGVIVWAILWSFGFIASLVAFGVSIGALFLYRLGSGGRVGRGGALRVALITVVTLLLAFASGIVVDGLIGFSEVWGLSWIQLITSSEFWSALTEILGEEGVLASYLPNFGLALLFGALGCFSVIRGAFREAAATPPAEYEYPIAPAANSGTEYPAVPSTDPTLPAAEQDPNAPRN